MRRILVLLALVAGLLAADPATAAEPPPGILERVQRLTWQAPFGADGDRGLVMQDRGRLYRWALDGTTTPLAGTGEHCFVAGTQGPRCGEEGAAGAIAILPTSAPVRDPRTGAYYFAEHNRIRKVLDGNLTTVLNAAGVLCEDDAARGCGDGGPARAASAHIIIDLAVGPDGSIYFPQRYKLRRIAPDGTISTVLGAEVCATPGGSCGDGGPAADARITWGTSSVDVAPDGRIAFTDATRIRVIEGGVVRTVAGGNGTCPGPADPCGNGGPGTSARLRGPGALAFDPDGRLYFVDNFAGLRRLDLDGTIRHVAGAWAENDGFCPDDEPGIHCGAGWPATSTSLWRSGGPTFVGRDLYLHDTGFVLRIRRPDLVAPDPSYGYRMVTTEGTVHRFGWRPSFPRRAFSAPLPNVVGGASSGTGGYWLVGADGGVFSFGDARFLGSASGRTRTRVVGMASTPDGRGYWLLEESGKVHTFGTAVHRGDAAGGAVGIAADPRGRGYWVGRGDGTVQAFGAPALGSHRGRLNQPIRTIVATPDGGGYWLLGGDGGVFTFGSARFFGSTGARRLNQPIIGMSASPTGRGYWLVARDGGVFSFGDGPFRGSAVGRSGGAVVAAIPG